MNSLLPAVPTSIGVHSHKLLIHFTAADRAARARELAPVWLAKGRGDMARLLIDVFFACRRGWKS